MGDGGMSVRLISGPGVVPSLRVAGPTSLVDLAPTVLGLLRLGGARDAEGEDLSRFLGAAAREERDPGSGPVFSEAARDAGGERSRSVRIGSWKLVREASGDERLFLVSAGEEQEVVVLRDRAARIRDELREKLADRIAQEREVGAGRP